MGEGVNSLLWMLPSPDSRSRVLKESRLCKLWETSQYAAPTRTSTPAPASKSLPCLNSCPDVFSEDRSLDPKIPCKCQVAAWIWSQSLGDGNRAFPEHKATWAEYESSGFKWKTLSQAHKEEATEKDICRQFLSSHAYMPIYTYAHTPANIYIHTHVHYT